MIVGNFAPFDIEIYNSRIDYVDSYKMLGINLDNKFKLKQQALDLNKKLCSSLPLFYSLKDILPYKIKLLLKKDSFLYKVFISVLGTEIKIF